MNDAFYVPVPPGEARRLSAAFVQKPAADALVPCNVAPGPEVFLVSALPEQQPITPLEKIGSGGPMAFTGYGLTVRAFCLRRARRTMRASP